MSCYAKRPTGAAGIVRGAFTATTGTDASSNGMNDKQSLSACALVRERIKTRARDPRLLLVPGLADDLKSIGEAFGELVAAVECLSRVAIAKHFSHELTPHDYKRVREVANGKAQ